MVQQKFLSIVLISILLFLPKESQSQFLNYNITTGRNYATIPFKLQNDFIVIPIKLDGILPLNFILDTGASSTIVIHKEYTDLIGAIYERQLFIQGVDRTQLIKALLTEGVDLEMTDVLAKDQHLLVLAENFIEFDKYSGTRIDGILGMDVFRRFIVKIDYETQQIYLFEPKKHNYNTTKYSSIPFIKTKGKMYLESKTHISGNEPTAVKWLIDSGAALTVLMQCQESDTTFLPENAVPGNIGKGLGGHVMGYLGKMKQVQFGEYLFENVIGNFQPLADSLYTPANAGVVEGILGNKILKQFHLIFDYNKSTVFARPNRYYNTRIMDDLSGIGITASGVNLNHFIIEEVYPNSPASEAGLQKGDTIKKVNGTHTIMMNLQGLERRLGNTIGKKVKMVIKRGEDKIKVQFYLKDYL